MKRIVSSLCVAALGVMLFFGAQKDVVAQIVADGTLSELWFAKEGEVPSIMDYNLDDYVKLGDYKNLEVDVNFSEVNEELINSSINQMLAEYPGYDKIDKNVVENGDTVNIDYVGKVDGETFEGGSAKGSHLTIGSNSFIEGFESGLVGVKVGEKKTLNLKFPEDYEESLAGKDVVFDVTVNCIEEEIYHTVDDLTDEFVNENLGFENVKALRDYVENYYKETAENTKKSDTRTAVIDKLAEISEVKIPEELLEAKVRNYLVSVRESVEENDTDLIEYLASNYNHTPAEFEKEIHSMMEKSVSGQMLLYAIANKENIKADEKGFNEYVDSFVNYYQFEDKESMFKEFPEKELKLAYTCNMVTDFLVDNSKVNYISEGEIEE